MVPRRLLWRLFPTYLVLIILCSGATGLYAWEAFRDFYLAETAKTLQAQAQIIREQLAGELDKPDQPAIEKRCQDLGRASSSRITVILPSGKVLAESQRDPESMENHADREEVKAALAGRVGQAVRHSYTLDADMMYVAVPVERGGRIAATVRVAVALTDIRHATLDIYTRLGIAVAIVVLAAGLLALWLARLLSRPLEEMRAGAARFARGELSHRIYVPRTRELAGLAESLNLMAAQLDEKIRTLTENRGQQEAVLSSMIEGVVAVDSQQNVISMNHAAADLLTAGPAPAAALGPPVVAHRDRGRPPGRRGLGEVIRNVELEQLVRQVTSGGLPVEGEIVIRKDDEDRNVQVHATVLRDARDQSIGALLVLNDVTRLRRLERVRRDFVANVSHELKTPITSIKGFVETLRDGAMQDAAQASRFLEIILTQADRLNAIIEDLLSLSRIEQEAEKHEIKLQAASLSPVLKAAAQDCQVKAAAKNITVQVDCPENLSARINGPLLEQAVANLIDNAIKYSEPGQTVQVQAEAANGASAVIRVRDWGCGIPNEHLPRLFERFYRVDKARSRKLGGTGLGLAIVKHIVGAHGGTVSVESIPGQGSTFAIRLPAN